MAAYNRVILLGNITRESERMQILPKAKGRSKAEEPDAVQAGAADEDISF